MAKRESRSKLPIAIIGFLLILMLVLAGLIVWLGMPMLAGETFGTASQHLSNSQKWFYGAQLLMQKNELLDPVCSDNQPIEVTIEMGDPIISITKTLAGVGLIQNQDSFRNYLIYKGIDTNIRAGNYEFTCSYSPMMIANKIENHYLESVVFDILPGWRAEEIANALITSGINVSPQDFMAVVKKPTSIKIPDYIPQGHSVEGFLFPGEYTVDRDITADGLVQLFINRFEQETIASGLDNVSTRGLNFYQTVIMASIIQRETYADEERPMIASVFYNRLASGMKLETDPTVQYALGFSNQWGWWKSPLSQVDLSIQSYYNTYLIVGLPPAPISNPDFSSLKAAENPADSNYYYFRAKCDNSGVHLFAQTLEEQIANACK